MNKAFYLSSCSTCIKIIKQLELPDNFELQDIKTNKITHEQIEEMKALSGSYEKLFSRRAIQYRLMNLKEKILNEKDYKNLILEEYTFLKRPVFIVNRQIFIGSAKNTIQELKQAIKNSSH